MSRSDAFSFQQLQTNGISVRAVVEGTGPLVIMVHGFPELWYSWRHQIRPIAEAEVNRLLLRFLEGVV